MRFTLITLAVFQLAVLLPLNVYFGGWSLAFAAVNLIGAAAALTMAFD